MDKAVDHKQQDRSSQVLDVIRIPELRTVGQQKGADKPDEPATPDGNPCGIQNCARVAQAARRQPPLHGSCASLQQFGAPSRKLRACARSDITDRIPRIRPSNLRVFSFVIYIKGPLAARTQCTNLNRCKTGLQASKW